MENPTRYSNIFILILLVLYLFYICHLQIEKNVRILLNSPNHMSCYVNTTRYCIWQEPIAMVIWDNKM